MTMNKLTRYIIFGALVIYLGSITALAKEKYLNDKNKILKIK